MFEVLAESPFKSSQGKLSTWVESGRLEKTKVLEKFDERNQTHFVENEIIELALSGSKNFGLHGLIMFADHQGGTSLKYVLQYFS